MSDVVGDVVRIAQKSLEFQEEIGRGGFSTVFKVKFKAQPRNLAAAKKLNKVDKCELHFLSRLKHPNIVSLIGVIDEKPKFYLILELCEGGSLREYLDLHLADPLPALLAFSWGEQGARAINYLQENSVIHRDIKSPNFLISSSKNLKLTDFGISKTANITITTAVQGTWGWTPPEVFKERHLSPRSDIYSYATVIWEILTRKVPLEGCEYPNVMYRVCIKKERHEIPTDCPPAIADLLRQCWEEERNKRPSIAEVVQALSQQRAEIQAASERDGTDIRNFCPCLQINIEFEGKQSPLNVYHGITVVKIKTLLRQEMRIPQEQVKVFYQRQELADSNLTLADYRVNEGATIQLRRCIMICLKSERGNAAILEAFGDETVMNLKTRIPFVEEGIPAVMGRLVHQEQDLKDDKSLSDYKVKNRDSLVIKYYQDIFVKCKEGHTIELRVRPDQTIEQIQTILHQREGIPPQEQHLIPQETLYNTLSKFTKKRNERHRLEPQNLLYSLRSQQLDTSATLYHSNIRNGDTLHMMDLQKALTVHEHMGWIPERTMVVIPSLNITDIKRVLNRVGYDFPQSPLHERFYDIRPLSYFDIKDGFTLSLRHCQF